MEGEGKEKPMSSGPMGKERGRRDRQGHDPHSYAGSPHKHSSFPSKQGAMELLKYQDSILPDITWGRIQAPQGHCSALCSDMVGEQRLDYSSRRRLKDECEAALAAP